MQEKITVYHIDDDPRMIRYISEVLQASAQLQYLGGTSDQAAGIAFVLQHQPALLLLDIEMPGLSGLGVATQLADSPVHIVFLTSHKDYAIEAFQLNVLHYLLKPVSPGELEALAHRYRNRQHNSTHTNKPVPDQLVIKHTQGIEFMPYNNILYIMGEGAYSHIYSAGQAAPIVASKHLKYFEEQLQGRENFIRISKSYIVNKALVKRIAKTGQETSFVFTDNTSFRLKSFHKSKWDELNWL